MLVGSTYVLAEHITDTSTLIEYTCGVYGILGKYVGNDEYICKQFVFIIVLPVFECLEDTVRWTQKSNEFLYTDKHTTELLEQYLNSCLCISLKLLSSAIHMHDYPPIIPVITTIGK